LFDSRRLDHVFYYQQFTDIVIFQKAENYQARDEFSDVGSFGRLNIAFI